MEEKREAIKQEHTFQLRLVASILAELNNARRTRRTDKIWTADDFMPDGEKKKRYRRKYSADELFTKFQQAFPERLIQN